MTHDPMVAALLREREGYARRGLADRVALVDEQLALRGVHQKLVELAEEDVPTPAPDARTEPPKGRRAPGKDKG